MLSSEEVTVISLDDWGRDAGFQPDLLKRDIEGHELDALRGGMEMLANTIVVQFEFGGCNIDTRMYFQDFYYLFKEQDFRLFRLGPRGLRPLAEYRESDETFLTSNFFAVSDQ